MSRLSLLFLAVWLSGGGLYAQNFQPVFPGLSGDELLDSVAAHYRPAVVLDYAHSRDTLYARVLAADDDTLRCIYSGYALWLDPTQDPTQYVYLNGSPLGMNTEHAYPQGLGASEGNARSDMHHLFPARIPVNEARGNSPYTDIPDAQTQQWFRGAQVFLTMPAQNKDQYSEARTGQFEPREAVKGDLARAVFYFYTIYRAQANAADPNFFALQRPTLCLWNEQDPVDSAEWVKTWRIAPYQDGKPNPYVLDCTLAFRAWCPEVPAGCAVPVREPAGPADLGLLLSPNPFAGSGMLEMTLPFSGALEIRLLSVLGKEIKSWQIAEAPAGAMSFSFDTDGVAVAPGVLEVRLYGTQAVARQAILVASP